MSRIFEIKKATREQVPLLVGLFGASGSGKTYSALRLATGIQRVSPGPIHVIDTEARRALHYADLFSFEHLEFKAPFGPLDYLSAIQYCVENGAKTIVIDSMSHEHEGPGGVLEMHEHYLDAKAGNDWKRREKLKFSAWIEPKRLRTRLINTMLQFSCNFILCFRAKEKIKIQKGEDPQPLGFMPIAGDEFVYEMTTSALLLPGCGGVPEWTPPEAGSKMMVKLPQQFQSILTDGKPMNEGHGEALAKWAAGDSLAKTKPDLYRKISADIAGATSVEQLEELTPQLADIPKHKSLPARDFKELKTAWAAKRDELKNQGDAYEDFGETGTDS